MSSTKKTQLTTKQVRKIPSKRTPRRQSPSRAPAKRQTQQERYLRELLSDIDDLEKGKKICEEQNHPYATVGGEYAPNNHLRCPVCDVTFYDEEHPAYKSAVERGEIDSRHN